MQYANMALYDVTTQWQEKEEEKGKGKKMIVVYQIRAESPQVPGSTAFQPHA